MIVETRATIKRIATMLCSMTVLVSLGYAVGGAGGYLAGQGRPLAIILGLLGGAVFTYLSLAIWKSYLRDIEIIDGRGQGGGEPLP